MSAAIYFHPEAYSTSSPKLMGRNAAGESFLKAYLKYGTSAELWALIQNSNFCKKLNESAQQYGVDKKINFIYNHNIGQLSQTGSLFYPGPDFAELAFKRRLFGDTQWTLTGITHTTSSKGAMDSIINLLSAPIYPWDSLICTSHAVKNNVEKLLDSQLKYLKDRFAISKYLLPQLPVIPLGIHTEDFSFSKDQKRQARKELNIPENGIVVLYVGRLSFHAKAHPLLMYQALQAASCHVENPIFLIECGWFANQQISNAFDQAKKNVSPNITAIYLDGRDMHSRNKAWASADIFCSFSDNLQETFGITPIEAMASSLPAVVSDWDGYKDTVRDSIDGFRIQTSMPLSGLGKDLASRHALDIDNYDMYCGYTSSLISVDFSQAVKAFVDLFQSPSLRKKMGCAGKERASNFFDWKNIIPRYERLWERSKEILHSQNSNNEENLWPARMDPFNIFQSYPTSHLTMNTVFSLVDESKELAEKRLDAYLKLDMIKYAKYIYPTGNELNTLLSLLATSNMTGNELISHFPVERQLYLLRSLSWLSKLNIIRIIQ